jgi:hypothetical protein
MNILVSIERNNKIFYHQANNWKRSGPHNLHFITNCLFYHEAFFYPFIHLSVKCGDPFDSQGALKRAVRKAKLTNSLLSVYEYRTFHTES